MIPLLNYQYSNLESIRVYDKNRQWHDISIAIYNRKFNTTLMHGVVHAARHDDIIQQILDQVTEYDPGETADTASVKTFITNPVNYFNVCYVDSSCGYGLIANQDIPANIIIGIYSGELTYAALTEPLQAERVGLYDMSAIFGEEEDIKIKLREQDQEIPIEIFFRADSFGDLTRFALHASDINRILDLEERGYLHYSINSGSILTANVSYQTLLYDKIPLNYFKTLMPIKKQELILINYGDDYWVSERAPQSDSLQQGMPCMFIKNKMSDEPIFDILSFDTLLQKFHNREIR